MKIFTSDQILEAASLLKKGELIAFPTETVYGLGAPIFQPAAIQLIFKAKGRPSDNPLIAHVAGLEDVEIIAEEIPAEFYVLWKAFSPGPLTIILKRNYKVPSIVSAGMPTIAIRMPSHPLALALIRAVGEPLVAPSANLSGKPSSTIVQHVIEDFNGKIAGVLDGGKTAIGIESTVISLLTDTPVLLRPGFISKEAIEEVLKKKIRNKDLSDALISPGMKYRHYAPRAKVVLVDKKPHLIDQNSLIVENISAENLYAVLRQADARGYAKIYIVCTAFIQNNLALMNRLEHASS